MPEARGAAFGTSGNSDEGEDIEEEDVYLPPSLCGSHLTVNFPLQVPIQCIIGKCGTKIKNKTWTASVNSFVRHITDIHRVNVDKKNRTNWCSLCHCDIGRQVVTHACFRLRPFFLDSGEKFDDRCKECGE